MNAKKHKELLKDYDTRLTKHLNKVLCLSNNSKRRDMLEDKVINRTMGQHGAREIIRTDNEKEELLMRLKYGANKRT